MSRRGLAATVLVVFWSAVAEAQWTDTGSGVLWTDKKVGIGVSAPSESLVVAGNIRSQNPQGSFSVGGAAPVGFPFFATNSAQSVSAAVMLHSNYATQATSYLGNFGAYGTYVSQNRNPLTGEFTDTASGDVTRAAQMVVGDTIRNRIFQVTTFASSPSGTIEVPRLLMDYSGNVGIGPSAVSGPLTARLTVDGNIQVTGNINAKYQDIAEWVPAADDLAAGTVVVLDPALGNGVMAATTPYDTRVAGVVSAQPGIVLGEESASRETIATTGRVRIRVDATHAPIAVGDLLVTSDKPGRAMKSIAVNVGGVAMHRPGTIVGKALEPLASGEGEILVLLSLQ